MNPFNRNDLTGVKFMEIEELEVTNYHPAPGGKGAPTQVHLLVNIKEFPHPIVLRMKSRRVLTELIEALRLHRDQVFPPGHN